MSSRRLNTVSDLPDANARLASDIAERLHVKAATLPDAISRGKARLPQALVVELQKAVEAESWLTHPQLQRQVDLNRIQGVHDRTRKFLAGVNLKRARERYWLGIATGLLVNLALLAVAVIAVLRWRGLI